MIHPNGKLLRGYFASGTGGRKVFIPGSLARRAAEEAPARFTWTARNPGQSVVCGDGVIPTPAVSQDVMPAHSRSLEMLYQTIRHTDKPLQGSCAQVDYNLASWENHQTWKDKGAEDILVRANRKWKQIVSARPEMMIDMGMLAYNLLRLLREFHLEGEEVKRSVEWLIRRLIKVASRISYHSRYWWVHVASAFPLRHHYQAVFGYG